MLAINQAIAYFIAMARNNATAACIDGMLRLMALGVVLSAIVLTPNAVQALDKPIKKYFEILDKRARNREYQRTVAYMKKQKLVSYKTVGSKKYLYLTEIGRKRAEKAAMKAVYIPRPERWDGYWHMVMFDIPESKKSARNYFTFRLKELGLIQLQKSVWLYPYPCQKQIEVISKYCDIGHYVNYVASASIACPDDIRQKFSFKF